jgi:hypothetical protein
VSDSLIPLSDDPKVEPGCIMATEVLVTQYLRPDGSFGIRTFYSGDGSLSQVLGLLVLGAMDINERSDR